MNEISTISQDEFIEIVKEKLRSKRFKPLYSHYDIGPSPTSPSAFVLILGAGFSYGVIPLTKKLMTETIGDYYFPDQDQSSMERDPTVLRKDSSNFWKEFNEVARKENLTPIDLGEDGLPVNPAAAYQSLFIYDCANAVFSQPDQNIKEKKERDENDGERFMKGFLQYYFAPGSEHGYGWSGRNSLNLAHMYLASILEAQQLGHGWSTCAFCRTIITTNFDTLLQNSLQMVNILYRITDRPERGLTMSDLQSEEGPIHLVYAHGSILRHNPASTIEEVDDLAGKNIEVLKEFMENNDVITIGYSGWNDGLMKALDQCDSNKHMIYWCDILDEPAPHVARFLEKKGVSAIYVKMGKSGADILMKDLYESLIPEKKRIDIIKRYQNWWRYIWDHK